MAMEPGDPDVTTEDIDTEIDGETDKELDDLAEETRKESVAKLAKTEAQAAEKAQAAIRPAMDAIRVSSDSTAQMDAMDATYSHEGSQDQNPSARSQKLRADASNYREDKVASQKRKGRWYTRIKGIALVCSVTSLLIAATNLVINIIKIVNDAQTPAPPPAPPEGLTEEQRQMLIKQIESWWSLPDATVWSNLADYCDHWVPSWQAQILFMDTIKHLSQKLPTPWTWRDDDLAINVDTLVNAYGAYQPTAEHVRSRILYDEVPKMKYDGFTVGTQEPLPRQVAADLIELAITQIVLRTSTEEKNVDLRAS